MTDARLPARWLTDRNMQRVMRDAELLRSYLMAVLHSANNETDGVIDAEDVDLGLIPHFDPDHIDTLVKLRVWQKLPRHAGWRITDYRKDQTTADEQQRARRTRELNRLRQQKKRERDAETALIDTDNSAVQSTDTGDVTGDITRDVPRDVCVTVEDRTETEAGTGEVLPDENSKIGRPVSSIDPEGFWPSAVESATNNGHSSSIPTPTKSRCPVHGCPGWASLNGGPLCAYHGREARHDSEFRVEAVANGWITP